MHINIVSLSLSQLWYYKCSIDILLVNDRVTLDTDRTFYYWKILQVYSLK